MKRLFLIVICALCWKQTSAQTLYVPSPQYATIQSAINDANNDDTIIVSAGTYKENINFLGKAITVQSGDPNDPNTVATTIIDGSNPADPNIGSVVTFANQEEPNSVLSGFTIQNGTGQSDPTVDWRLWDGDNGDGGGAVCSNASPTLTKNIFKNCRAEYGGGAIFCHNDASPVITHNTFLNNYAGWYGGAIFARLNCSPTISNNIIKENECKYLGGAIYMADHVFSNITNNWIENNTCQLLHGGAIYYFVNSSPIIACNFFIGNICNGTANNNPAGAAILGEAGTAGKIINNLFTQNVCTNAPGAVIKVGVNSTDLVANNIIYENGSLGIKTTSTTAPVIRNNNLWSNIGGNYGGALTDQTGINGNISADPNLAPILPEPFTVLELNPDSPCIDTGSDTDLPIWLTEDYDGTERIVNAVIDMGPQEYHAIAVPQDFQTIQNAVNAATTGDEIIVSPGFYQENVDFLTKNIRLRSLNPLDSNCIEQTIIDGNNLASCVTIISGQNPSTSVTGFTIQNGHGEFGGGVYIDYTSGPTIMYNYITNNSADRYGGGIDSREDCYSTIIHNTVIDNYADDCGGGIHNGARSSCIIQNNKIMHNSARLNGGAVYSFNHTDILISNNQIANNTANGGAGVYQWDGDGIIEGNSFTENSASLYGGAIMMLDSRTLIRNNIICANTAEQGGGIRIQSGGSCEIINNTITGNLADDTGAGIAVAYNIYSPITNNIVVNNAPGGIYVEPKYFPSEPNIVANNLWNNQGGNYLGDITDQTGINGNLSADPCFVTPGYWDNNSTPADANDDYWVQGDYHIGYFSPCRDTGTDVNAPAEDFDANQRPIFTGIDMGAYELAIYDLSTNGTVDFGDLQLLLDQWLSIGAPLLMDLNTDGIVDWRDFALLADDWRH